MDHSQVRTRVLDVAEELFYARGIQAVGMDEIRAQAEVSLKRLYLLFPAKEQLVEGFLDRRDIRWRARLAQHVARSRTPRTRILAVFDWLYLWFCEPDFRGCAWVNVYGELGPKSASVRERARQHKLAFHEYLAGLVAGAGLSARVSAAITDQLFLLAEGAMVTAGIQASPQPAIVARRAAEILLAAQQQRH